MFHNIFAKEKNEMLKEMKINLAKNTKC